ncbi:50S ribosomal protein L4 [Deltaproteobacteria bacterium]|nr:50S ribosomal protein L4 [Deltaproteobacteria bacterium]
MAKVDVYNLAKEKVGTADLSDAVFGAEVKEHLFHLVVRAQLAARRQGTHATKQRAMVAGGGRKPWKQKGTGRARAGSTRSPQFRGGGSVFGPQPRSHAFAVNKKVRRAALRCALSRRSGEAALVVVDRFSLPEAKTRHFRTFMKAFGFESLLVVLPTLDEAVSLAARNIPGVTVLPVEGLNVYDVLRHKNMVVAQDAIGAIVERLEVANG